MNLREPKKKRRVKLKEQPPFPIVLGDQYNWVTYTAHLTELGSCIIDANEIAAVHSMGYFGKGSLSRGFPAFGKARYGAPPVIRNRQWIRRQEWLKQFNELSMEPNSSKYINSDEQKNEESNIVNLKGEKNSSTSSAIENTPDIIEIDTNSTFFNKNNRNQKVTDTEIEISQISLDTSNGDDVYVIVNKDINEQSSDSKSNDKDCTDVEERDSNWLEDLNFKEDDMCITDNTSVQSKLLVLSDSDSETENYLKEINPKIAIESFPIQETLHLTFEETFFLLYGLGCLNLIDFDGNLLDIDSAWHLFCKADRTFVQKYVVYHYFRSKGWVVKPGLKYGGDFLLYKQGPPFYHASYIVIVDVLEGDSLIRDENKSMHKSTWNNILGLERLSETAAKEILFAQVLWPSSMSQTASSLNVDILSEFSVRELLWRRWNPKNNKDEDNEDYDSY
ncbi:PREDICTED: tRNA-splicing endonuclease subunit Sen2 [Dufourea novaeangliae]|uniref:tRNA-splicing endonuclease subunit Sen2 n=1 Tax=Dufourea novaeangliae TaxID=178035 RepID=A0A154PTW1_DUFNO|nr:PREDICTED: tRNA-splicing endonuclease subunit Sen2 [Dufourea novaeangliae]KZC14874.1 tRNA-splicing endonuclease subunit Sen2 [Dufourea novaeangliae]